MVYAVLHNLVYDVVQLRQNGWVVHRKVLNTAFLPRDFREHSPAVGGL